MKKGKYAKRGVATKVMLIVLAMMLVVGATVGGTIAWLIDDTDPVTNTFTYGDINITLDETAEDFKMVPGSTITKDPVITVEKDSEACWLFVKIEKSDNFDDFMTFDVDAGWKELPSETGVYYCEVAASADDQDFPVLKDDQVLVSEDVTKTDVNALTDDTAPTLTFTAYAVQKANVDDAATAWGYANG